MIGEAADLTYDYDYLGAGPQTLLDVAEGRHPFAEVLKNATCPMLILGQGAVARFDGAAILRLAAQAAKNLNMLKPDEGWNGFNILHDAAARVGGLDLGFVPQQGGLALDAMLEGARDGDIELLYLLGADELDMSQTGDAFVVYQGSHGDRGARFADIILPGAAYTEKSAHLRQHRRPGADGAASRLPAGRCARGLDHHPRAVGKAGRQAAIRQPAASCAPNFTRNIPISPRPTRLRPAIFLILRRSASATPNSKTSHSLRRSTISTRPTPLRAPRRS